MSHPSWYPIFKAEYFSLTAKMRSKRRFIPFLLVIGTIFLIFIIQLVSDYLIQTMSHSTNANQINQFRETLILNNIDFIFLLVNIITFLAFYIPITASLERMKPQAGLLDIIVSKPVTNRDIFLGAFMAEMMLTPIFLGAFAASFITFLTFSTINLALPNLLISFIFMFIISSLGLWIGIFSTRFLLRVNNKSARAIASVGIALLSLILLYSTVTILKEGYTAVQSNPLLMVLPPTWMTLIVFSFVFKPISLEVISVCVLLLCGFAIILIIGGLKRVNHINLITPHSTTESRYTPSIRGKISYSLRLMMYRHFRDLENWGRLLLALSFSLLLFYLFSFFLGSIEAKTSLSKIYWAVAFFLCLLGGSSTLTFIEAAYYSLEFQEILPVVINIPHAIKKLGYLRLELLMVITFPLSVGMVVILQFLLSITPFPIIETIILVYLCAFGMGTFLLGIYCLFPVENEQDPRNVTNGLIYAGFVMITALLLGMLLVINTSWNLSQLFIVYFVISIIINIFSLFVYHLGLQNQITYDLGSEKGKYTKNKLALLGLLGEILGMLFLLVFLGYFITIIGCLLTEEPYLAI